MKQEKGEWKVVSAGPTTSARMEIFESEFIEKFGIKIIIGKGGMGSKTLNALAKFGAVYCQYTGGAGSLMVDAVKKVDGVYFLEELGIPEAVWLFRVDKLGPLIVTMDSKMNSLHDQVRKNVQENLKRVKEEL
jgi:tartrate/fumarate subfamily iron-sulfur-dependent hydro-lyase beta chain